MFKALLDNEIKKEGFKSLTAAMTWLTKNYGDVESHRILSVLNDYNDKVASRTAASKNWRLY